MGYVKNKVAENVADRMTERYGVKHHAVHNNKSGMLVVMRESDIKKVNDGHVGSVDVVYP